MTRQMAAKIAEIAVKFQEQASRDGLMSDDVLEARFQIVVTLVSDPDSEIREDDTDSAE